MVDHAHPRKLFTAERQRLKEQGLSPVAPAPMPASSSEVMSAINALRDDIRGLEQLIRGDAMPVETVAPAHAPDYEQKLAEVTLLKTEIRALSLAIEHTKSEIAALRPTDAKDDRLVAVANELDAIVSATEGATDTILECAEKIDGLAQQLQAQAGDGFSGVVAEELREVVVSIFEACNFQDITGQRIGKVVRTLQFIEDRVNRMIDIWGHDTFHDLAPPPEVKADDEKSLLNGPALENQGVSQADIDKLFD
ncbi:MAG TPA: hypothetical protein HPQ04_09235 [Rhodospirillaceae bacterium]|nr:hypothetical protein [Rhodospirillaceae bacterium]